MNAVMDWERVKAVMDWQHIKAYCHGLAAAM